MALLLKKTFQVIRRGIGAVELRERGLDQNDPAHRLRSVDDESAAPSLASKAKQCFPVERKISIEGRFLHFKPKSVQERGKAGSHVTRKCLHRRQSGARSGIIVSWAGSGFIGI